MYMLFNQTKIISFTHLAHYKRWKWARNINVEHISILKYTRKSNLSKLLQAGEINLIFSSQMPQNFLTEFKLEILKMKKKIKNLLYTVLIVESTIFTSPKTPSKTSTDNEWLKIQTFKNVALVFSLTLSVKTHIKTN